MCWLTNKTMFIDFQLTWTLFCCQNIIHKKHSYKISIVEWCFHIIFRIPVATHGHPTSFLSFLAVQAFLFLEQFPVYFEGTDGCFLCVFFVWTLCVCSVSLMLDMSDAFFYTLKKGMPFHLCYANFPFILNVNSTI